MLLRSRPDTVHGFLLRKTRTSTSLIRGSSTALHPRFGITPAVADCRYRAPLSPRLVRPCYKPARLNKVWYLVQLGVNEISQLLEGGDLLIFHFQLHVSFMLPAEVHVREERSWFIRERGPENIDPYWAVPVPASSQQRELRDCLCSVRPFVTGHLLCQGLLEEVGIEPLGTASRPDVGAAGVQTHRGRER